MPPTLTFWVFVFKDTTNCPTHLRWVEKSLGNQFNIQLQQQMGVFQASMLEAMKSLREEMQSMKKASEAEVYKTSR